MIIKICGITNAEDARHALAAGADWIGLNLLVGPRRIQLEDADRILGGLPEPDRAVALIAAAEDGARRATLDRLHRRGVRRVQLYGSVTAAVLQQTGSSGFEIIVVQRLGDAASIEEATTFFRQSVPRPDYLLIDAADAKRLGGTGKTADWALLGEARAQGRMSDWPPLLLAGGLTPDNVAEAIRAVSPDGVDVSSGVEASLGRKDATLVEKFVSEARSAQPGR